MKYDLNINPCIGKDGLTTGLYPVIIYQLIRQYSNENHWITVLDIRDTLMEYWKGDEKKDSNKANIRRTIKRNLQMLLPFDSKIHALYKDEIPFQFESDSSYGKIYYLWYEQDLSQTDLQLLSDAIVYSKHLSNDRRLEIIKNLMRTAGQSSTSENRWIRTVIKDSQDISQPIPGDFYQKLEYINDAIENKNCICFDYTFSGPHNEKYKVRSYKGVSPYKIIHEDGIYYLIAARESHSPHNYDNYEAATVVVYLEIHKLDKIHTDYESTYLEIEETVAKDKTIQDFLGCSFNPHTHEAIPFRFKEDVHLRVSSRGLDVLLDRFGKRMNIIRLPETNDLYAGPTKELAYIYDITIKDVARNDWYELLILLLRYPISDINFTKGSAQLINLAKMKLQGHLQKIEEYEPPPTSEPRKIAKPPYNSQ